MKGRKMAEQPKISVKNLTKKFDDLTVLNDVSFEINKGDFVCIVGPTGCGKTTFLNLLAKLIEPTAGQILIDGEPADPKKHNISFVFQEPSNFPWLTVEENIKFNLKLKGIDKKEIQKRTNKILDIIALEDKRDVYPQELSVSAEQRVVIGRSFAVYPDLLLMDEPYGQMDIKVRYYLEDEVLKLWKETGSTVLFITHNIEEAIYLSQKCLVMTPKPTTVKAIIENPLPYPRNVSDPEFIKLREKVTDMIKWW
jgi:sulfonate transport system ATP-binding protein